MEDRPWLFSVIPGLTPTTQLYTSRRSDADAPQEYRYTTQVLANYLVSFFGFAINLDTTLSVVATGSFQFLLGELFEVIVEFRFMVKPMHLEVTELSEWLFHLPKRQHTKKLL